MLSQGVGGGVSAACRCEGRWGRLKGRREGPRVCVGVYACARTCVRACVFVRTCEHMHLLTNMKGCFGIVTALDPDLSLYKSHLTLHPHS